MPSDGTRDDGGMRLPEVLTPLELPLAELSAARLDGELFALDEGFVPIDQVVGLRHRALSLVPFAAGRLIAEQRTAAWVYGALPFAPPRHEFCAAMGARLLSRPGRLLRMNVREVIIGTTDIAQLFGLQITTPVRTVVDLVRIADNFGDADATLVRDLMAATVVSLQDCIELMERRRNLPGKRRASDRLRMILDGAKSIGVESDGGEPDGGESAGGVSAGADPVDVIHRIDATNSVEHAVEMRRIAHLEHETAERETIARGGHRRREDVDVVL